MLEAINLSKHYNGTVALDSLDLKIEPGEVFCLLGPNGAGKTTTINLFLNFIAPTSGAAKIKDLDVSRHSLQTKRYVAYIPEQVRLYKNLTGLENPEYFGALAGHVNYGRQDLLGFFKEVGLTDEVAQKRMSIIQRACASEWELQSPLPREPKPCYSMNPPVVLTPKPQTNCPNCCGN